MSSSQSTSGVNDARGGNPMDSANTPSEKTINGIERVEDYLQTRLQDESLFYIKASEIPDDLNEPEDEDTDDEQTINAIQVGIYLQRVRERDNGIEFTKWGGNATENTWCITTADQP